MNSKKDNLSRLEDIEHKQDIEKIGENRAVVSTGSNQQSDHKKDITESQDGGLKLNVKLLVNGEIKETTLKSDSMRGLVQKFIFWSNAVSDENLTDMMKK